MELQKRRTLVLSVILGLLCLPNLSHAQAIYGSIYGTVADKAGAVIPNATVTVTDESKGTSVEAQSNGSGDYTVQHLIPDTYDIKVTVGGFKAFEQKGIVVAADSSVKVDASLEVGGESETVTVNADTVPELKADRADVSTVFAEKTVADLPLANRNFTSLQLLLPGAQQLGWSHAADENPQGSQQIQIDGQAFGGVAYELDGTDNQDPDPRHHCRQSGSRRDYSKPRSRRKTSTPNSARLFRRWLPCKPSQARITFTGARSTIVRAPRNWLAIRIPSSAPTR